ncbi:nuclear receptor coactivator 5 isoform X2 [Nematolebias whitei]|uniref:nuclear receptor coactivator 5 isoform X2 n=1 Tax=Nematolebias whitei TaxID=451745 RepID=UPI00189756AD|nr:nuclear receptor coactivator 5 isoform X2 [Nematolebias whitei]
MAVERRQTQQSPPRRASYSKEPHLRSRSPVFLRDGRQPQGSHDGRDPGREPRQGSHSRDPAYYRSGSRDKDLRSAPRDPALRAEYDRFIRGGNGGEDCYRRKDERYRDPYLDPWNGRREPDDRARPEERRRDELYRQYYEELQRRYNTERPVDCSVIVVNKMQKEYAETVGRKIRDLGMVVDLIFLNSAVSLTQALEDVSRARTPFAIIITQQHQEHRSCTVNILFGTPQEHRNMPMQDAMLLVSHNYDNYKVENRENQREEIARKAAKMADDVLLREPDRESHPTSLLTSITLLSENRFLTPEELERLIAYLQDKRARLVRGSADSVAAPVHVGASAGVRHDAPPLSAALPSPSTRAPTSSSHRSADSSASTKPDNQQELQAKVLSLFNSSSGPSQGSSSGTASSGAPQPHPYGSLGPSQNPSRPSMSGPPSASQSYNSQPGRMPIPSADQRPPMATSGINFDNPSVQNTSVTFFQSGPSRNSFVGSGSTQQPPPRAAPNMGQGPPMSMYPRHY